MKLTQKPYRHRKPGMTLLELTVVILVLLTLISILFVGARAWKRGADRSSNILNIRNVQQAVRGHESMYQMKVGDELLNGRIVGDADENYMRVPTPPADLEAYTYLDAVPDQGVLYITNNADDAVYGFSSPDDYADW
ncbi:MAG: type II secretion system protein [Luteolibacter sp.]|jgi:type II secretory pathway pseudopilin PulG